MDASIVLTREASLCLRPTTRALGQRGEAYGRARDLYLDLDERVLEPFHLQLSQSIEEVALVKAVLIKHANRLKCGQEIDLSPSSLFPAPHQRRLPLYPGEASKASYEEGRCSLTGFLLAFQTHAGSCASSAPKVSERTTSATADTTNRQKANLLLRSGVLPEPLGELGTSDASTSEASRPDSERPLHRGQKYFG